MSLSTLLKEKLNLFSSRNIFLIENNSFIYCREDGGFSGRLNMALWSDPSGSLSSQYDLFDEEEGQCLDGVVIIDDEGIVRHAMTTSLDCKYTANNTLEMVRMLKVYKVDEPKPTYGGSARAVSPVKFDPEKVKLIPNMLLQVSYE